MASYVVLFILPVSRCLAFAILGEIIAVMRYKKGSKVEVWCQNEMPSGSWRCAEIVCGNGHTYTIRYDKFPGASDKEDFKKLPRKLMRPRPPLTKLSQNLFPGDVVEVLHNYSWNVATVSTVWGQKYLVRLVGSSQEIEVNKHDLRMQQHWQNGEWIVVGKSFQNCGNGNHREQSNLKAGCNLGSQIKKMDAKMSFHLRRGCATAKNYGFQESHIVSSRTLKRGSPCYSQVEAYEGTAQKFRLAEKEAVYHQFPSTNPFLLPGKVDIASTTEVHGVKFIHVPLNKKTAGFSEMDVEKEKRNGSVGCSCAICLEELEPNYSDDIPCSVGSCSVRSYSHYELPCFSTAPVEDTEDHCSDAESFCELRYEETNHLLPTKEELAAEIHMLELHAYRCTLEALHASGPLSWEQESLVTNLRISLHISNDEHLVEIRNLISTNNSIAIS